MAHEVNPCISAPLACLSVHIHPTEEARGARSCGLTRNPQQNTVSIAGLDLRATQATTWNSTWYACNG